MFSKVSQPFFIIALFILMFAQNAIGQDINYNIVGKVIDAENNKPLEFATISVYTKSDNALVGGGLSEMDGGFNIETKSRDVYVLIEYLSYKSKKLEMLTWTSGETTLLLPSILLEMDGVALESIEIVGQKSETQFTLDKRVFNVGRDLANRGGSAQDVLDNVPSVTVDIDGSVSLRGSTNVRILIDGRPSGLLGIDGSNGLKSISANMIERIEVITNPSARYEAEGMSGIINIVLKKDANKGFNGTFDISSGYPNLFGATANLNFRRKNTNFFVNYAFNKSESPSVGYTYQERYSQDSIYATHILRDGQRNNLSNSLRAGIDYNLTAKSTLTASFLYRVSQNSSFTPIRYYDFTFLQGQERSRFLVPTLDYTLRTDNETESSPTSEYTLEYKKDFKREGENFKASIQYNGNSEVENSNYDESFYLNRVLENNILKQRSINDENQNSLVIQADYVLPLNKTAKFEAGLRSGTRKIANDFLVEQLDQNLWNPIEGLSNDFRYTEIVEAGYLIYGNKLNKFSYQGGLRAEYSFIETSLLQTNENYPRDFFNLFPSGHLNYELKGQNQVQLSYSRRIQRPRSRELNPFMSFSDNRNFFAGNPNLDPELTDSYELGHIKFWDKANIGSSIYYRNTNNVIQRWREFRADGTTFTTPLNLANSENYGMEFLFAYNPQKWLRMDGNLNIFRNKIDGSFEGTDLSADSYSWFSRLGARFTFWKNTDVQLRLNYRAPVDIPQGVQREIYVVDLAINKDFFNNNMSLTIAARDLLNTRRRNLELGGDGFDFYERSEQQWRRAPIMVTLSYRLNAQKERKKGARGDGNDFDGGDI